MKVVTLQDIIVENNGINIIQAGTSIIIDEAFPGVKAIAKTAGHAIMNPGMLKHQAALKVREQIHSYIESLPRNEREVLKGRVNIKHNVKDKDSDDYNTTTVRAPNDFCVGLQKFLSKVGYDSTVQPSWKYDIDDLHELGDKAPEDVKGIYSKLHINHITEKDYDRAANKKQNTEQNVEQDIEQNVNKKETETKDTEALDVDFQKEWAAIK